ncbi:MAG: hypothetical protein MRZ79_04740 [Bacteroidia bacterium]|nr:hypothetical protein [Bacteroidia bacterium]
MSPDFFTYHLSSLPENPLSDALPVIYQRQIGSVQEAATFKLENSKLGIISGVQLDIFADQALNLDAPYIRIQSEAGARLIPLHPVLFVPGIRYSYKSDFIVLTKGSIKHSLICQGPILSARYSLFSTSII